MLNKFIPGLFKRINYFILIIPVVCFYQCKTYNTDNAVQRPNILFYITDDQSWLHTSISGDNIASTPGFDRVAREGVYFANAFTPSPSCAPCRASILTGRYPWQLEDGALLFGGIPVKYPLFTHLLENAGYESAMCYKGYWPGNMIDTIYHTHPLGKAYNVNPSEPYPGFIAACDYSASFEKFMNERDTSRPFFFWMGVSEPHRGYSPGIGRESGLSADSVSVPGFLPDVPEIRDDLLDYYFEINHQDKHLVKILDLLEQRDELDNTLIIVTSDNGMPFPGAKANLYEYGTHIPLAIRWGDVITKGRVEKNIVNLAGLATTVLNSAGIKVPEEMTAESLLPYLITDINQDKKNENFTVTAIERHSWSRKGGLTYPSRALRTPEWLLIHNFKPDRYPAGDPPPFKPVFYDSYGDVDDGPAKRYLLDNNRSDFIHDFFARSFGKRPEFELFHIPSDPSNMNNVAGKEDYEKVLSDMKKELFKFLKDTGDPILYGDDPWSGMPFYLLNDKAIAISMDTHPDLF